MHTPEEVTLKALEQLKASKADCLVSWVGLGSAPALVAGQPPCPPLYALR